MFLKIDDRHSKGIPLYVQIRETIRKKISDHEIAIGTRLPAETNLAESFGVSRMTVRQAINGLVSDGLLIRKHGTGTIVCSRKIIRDYTRLTGFHEDALSLGRTPTSRVLKFEIIHPPEIFRQKLMLKKTEKVFHALRLRCIDNNQIYAFHELYVPQSVCPWFGDVDLENDSLYNLYKEHELAIEWGRQTIEARSATEEQAQYLQIPVASPILWYERTSYTDNNIPVETGEGISPGDRFSINLILKR